MCRYIGISAIGLLAIGSVASADVVEFAVSNSRIFTQVSTVAPSSAHTYELAATIELATGDAKLATLNGINMTEADAESWEHVDSFPNLAAMNGAYPASQSYDLEIKGGTLGVRGETLLLPAQTSYPPIPALSPLSFTALKAANANQSLFLQWTAVTGNANLLEIEITETVSGLSPVEMQLPLGQTSVLIPAGNLQQNTAYMFTLTFANANMVNGLPAPTGFGISAAGSSAYISELQIPFQTAALVPCVELGQYGIAKTCNYEQVSNGLQPTDPISYDFSAGIDSATAGAFGATSLLVGNTLPAQPLAAEGLTAWELNAEFIGLDAKLDLDTAYPNPELYTLEGDSGSLGLRSQGLLLGMDAYPPAPVLVGSSYADLQGVNPIQSLLVRWAPAAGGTDRVFVEVYDVQRDQLVLEAQPVLGNSSFALPSNALLAERDYEFRVSFANSFSGNGDDCPGFGSSSSETAAFVSETRVAFTTSGRFDEICNGNGGDQMGCTSCPCGNNAPAGTVGGCLNSTGAAARLQVSGDASVSLPMGDTTDLRMSITGAPAFAFCMLISGDSLAPASAANPCFGLNTGGLTPAFDGLRCAIVNTRRHGGRAADGLGQVGVSNDPWGGEGGPPAGLALASGGFFAGQTRYFQVVNRDDPALGCMRGLNSSQAARITFTP